MTPDVKLCPSGHVVAIVFAHGIEIRTSKFFGTFTGTATIHCLHRVANGRNCGAVVHLEHQVLDKPRQDVLAIA